MTYLLIYIIYILFLIFTIIFSIQSFKIIYFIIDLLIIGIFFTIGILGSVGLSSWIIIITWYLNYVIIRFTFTVIIYIIKRIKKSLILFNNRMIIAKIFISINTLLNIVILLLAIEKLAASI